MVLRTGSYWIILVNTGSYWFISKPELVNIEINLFKKKKKVLNLKTEKSWPETVAKENKYFENVKVFKN